MRANGDTRTTRQIEADRVARIHARDQALVRAAAPTQPCRSVSVMVPGRGQVDLIVAWDGTH
jgi:hypothetical protein